MRNNDALLCTAVQKGSYAEEGLRLCESLRNFHPEAELAIYVLYPATPLNLDEDMVARFEKMQATVVSYKDHWLSDIEPVNRKLVAMSHFERVIAPGVKRIIWCDADVVCFGSISELLASTSERISVCPVRGKGVGLGATEPLPEYWKNIAAACHNSEPPGFSVVPTHGGGPIRPYFNTGVVGYPTQIKLFSRAFQALLRLVSKTDLQQYTASQRFYLEQCVLSETILTFHATSAIEVLTPKWNCSMLNLQSNQAEDLKLLHYNHQLSVKRQRELEQALRLKR